MQPVIEHHRPLERVVAQVGDRWALLIVDALAAAPRRFNDLLAALPGIATNVLSQRLKRLEADGVVVARAYSHRPRRHSYQLTAAGRELARAVELLAQWGATLTPGEGEPVTHELCGTALEPRWHCPTCAQVVSQHEEQRLRYV